MSSTAVLIHGAPKIMLHSPDPNEHLVQVPLIAGTRTASAQTVGEGSTEFLAPAPHRLIGDDNATFSEDQLDISQAEAEHVIQPYSVADDLGGKAMAVVRIWWRFHSASLAGLKADCQSRLS